MFDFITREMISFLSLVHSWGGSWGWAIVALTLVVRLLIFPLSMKQFASMRDMQRIQPKMKELQAKYKDQPQVMNQELMKLYQDHKVNPFGGCLPLLVQMPFLIALYSALIGDEFKKLVQHAGFGPIEDLTRVGFTTHWHSPMLHPNSFIDSISMGLLHLDAVFLVVLFGVTTYITQRISMTDPNDPMQKQMLTMMPIMITFMFVLIPLPAGVLLYTVVSNFFTMGQYLLLKRMYPSDPVPALPASQATIDVAARPRPAVQERKLNVEFTEATAAESSQEDLLDAALDFLAELLGALDVAGDIAITHEDDHEVHVEVQAEEDGDVLVANNGQAIQAIQYLMNVIYGTKLDRRVVVDVDGWRAEHEARLHSLAETAALRVKESGKRFAFEPMPPSDRRQVHHYVKAHHGELVTYSIGEEPNRRIVLEPEGAEGPRPGEVPQRRGGGGRPPRNFDGRRGGAYQGRRQR